ncbi:MAG: hypothetical protein F4Y44_07500 [Chloroflexi bacterium]|nr:hypothetical protein [Chloroflexota bacterium]
MTEAVILERREQGIVSEKLNSKATREIEELLEESEQVQKKTGKGGWHFRMVSPGVRYYSF